MVENSARRLDLILPLHLFISNVKRIACVRARNEEKVESSCQDDDNSLAVALWQSQISGISSF
ncbi:hypothetical protein TorRG33x02_325480 [Trema orientale]|uniref:Uncharacterized protein n=1 Tax=Trema orientale TaxID=63057 RepID=A0A2P5BCZ8_TREOI|nr:hypothetical protein TorRG33x02_325480 [Trema orientale]